MPRPPKWRCIRSMPGVTYFSPAGVSPAELEEVQLSFEEAEAIRLKDLEGWEQEQCAKSMAVSRTTFHRVLGSARGKIADAILNGKAIRIEGGNFGVAGQMYRCNDDSQEWQVPFETMRGDTPRVCPRCNSTDIQAVPHPGFERGRHRGRWRGE